MPSLLEFREEVLHQIRPSQTEVKGGLAVFQIIQAAIRDVAEQQGIEVAYIQLEGSSGRKQTQLRGHRELDIFICLPLSIIPKELQLMARKKTILRNLLKRLVQNLALKAAESAGCQDIEIAYAEHPYVTASLDGFKVDLVFCFDLPADHIKKQGPLTAVDRTPHHSIFVDENLSAEQRDEVRLLKAFLQTAFVYGDSSPVGRSGFTGFSSEMLIYHHNDFETVITNLTELLKQPLDYFQRSTSTIKSLFQSDYLIIVDPTDPARNVAASIDQRAFRYANHLATQFLQDPQPQYFLTRPIPILSDLELKALKPNYFVFEFEDTTGWHYTKTRDKLYRYFTQLTRFLKKEPTGEPRFGETLFEDVLHQKNHAIALRVAQPKIAPTHLRVGPPLHLVDAVKRFRKKHPDATLRAGRYQTRQKRKFTTTKKAIEHYLKERPLPSKLILTSVTSKGKTKLGKQALWILTNAVFPLTKTYKNLN